MWQAKTRLILLLCPFSYDLAAPFGRVETLRILIADDAPMVRAGLKLLLETHEGWSVCAEAENGQDAVQKALDLNPDVALLDVSMPNLNGFKAAEIIKKHLPSATIYFVTQLSFARNGASHGRSRRSRLHREGLYTNRPSSGDRSGCRLSARRSHRPLKSSRKPVQTSTATFEFVFERFFRRQYRHPFVLLGHVSMSEAFEE